MVSARPYQICRADLHLLEQVVAQAVVEVVVAHKQQVHCFEKIIIESQLSLPYRNDLSLESK